jgi:hypothetical protein
MLRIRGKYIHLVENRSVGRPDHNLISILSKLANNLQKLWRMEQVSLQQQHNMDYISKLYILMRYSKNS